MSSNLYTQTLGHHSFRWLVTGAAGFIGSHLCEALLALGQDVVALDNFATGSLDNIALLERRATECGGSFRFIEGTIVQLDTCSDACRGVDFVLHQAALGSVPRSIADPLATHHANLTGTLNMLLAARDARVKRFVFASSSSVYGDEPNLPKVEQRIGVPLAPYATTKLACEYYARQFTTHFGLETVGLRYFNVFGPRQNPDGAYAAVIPRWTAAAFRGVPVTIFGDGETSRDFCYVANVVQANLLAAVHDAYDPGRTAFNIAAGRQTSLNRLYSLICANVAAIRPGICQPEPVFGPERAGDVRHSLADIGLAAQSLGYAPTHDVEEGLSETVLSFATPVA